MAGILSVTREFSIGVDLGQKQDFTALCVVERAEMVFDTRNPVSYDFHRETRFSVRYMERVRLQTSYPDVVERVRKVAMDPALAGSRSVVVDATGVGAPVVDLLCAGGLDCEIVPVVITGGESGSTVGRDRRVPKKDLMAGLQLMFDQGQLQICRGLPETELLLKELAGMRVSGARGSGHDDMVLALALACWRVRTPGKWNWFGGRPDGR